MSKRRSKAAVYAPYPTKGNEKYSALPHRLITSKAYQTMSTNGKSLFIACLDRCFTQDIGKLKKDFSDVIGEEMPLQYFTLSYQTYVKTYGAKGKNEFYKGIAEMIEHGFIDCVIQGKLYHKDNLFKYSDRWEKYGTELFEIAANVRTLKGKHHDTITTRYKKKLKANRRNLCNRKAKRGKKVLKIVH